MTHTMDDTRGRKVDFYCLWHEMKKLGGSFQMVCILDGEKLSRSLRNFDIYAKFQPFKI